MLLIAIGLLYWDVFVSLVGVGFLIYGKKRPDYLAMATGLALAVYPYFVNKIGWSIAIGVGIVAVYAFLKRIVRL
ncbi:MAG: hypothetical protein ABH871_08850 [Pseudomonadota bacterium]